MNSRLFRRRFALPVLLIPALGGWALAPARQAPRTHVVHMEANRFVPAESRVSPGDTVRFVNGEGGPHNVEFAADSIPAATTRAALDRAMPGDKLGALSGPLLIDPDETYMVVVPRIPEGRYAFVCLPHQAFMRGALVVGR